MCYKEEKQDWNHILLSSEFLESQEHRRYICKIQQKRSAWVNKTTERKISQGGTKAANTCPEIEHFKLNYLSFEIILIFHALEFDD